MDNEIKTTAEAAEADVLPDARVVMMEDGGRPVEKTPLPAGIMKKPMAQKSPAEWAYERIVLYIRKFEEQLDSDQEVGMGFVGGDMGTLRIQGMGFFAPDLITFYGADQNGAKTQLVQHVSQLNVMLVAAPKEDAKSAPRRIGFKLAADLDNQQT
jgi:uncharacterized protein DUF6173